MCCQMCDSGMIIMIFFYIYHIQISNYLYLYFNPQSLLRDVGYNAIRILQLYNAVGVSVVERARVLSRSGVICTCFSSLTNGTGIALYIALDAPSSAEV